MAETLNLVVRQLGPELLNDYMRFFDSGAFTDFPEWSGCYCAFHDTAGRDWDASSDAGPEHRATRTERISSGKAHGLLAYVDGKVVGWCNAQPRADFLNLRSYAVAVDDDSEKVGSIMCFLVAPEYRMRGISATLLNGACVMFRSLGLDVAEAYPKTTPTKGSEEIPWAEEFYKGPLGLYLKAGFKLHRQLERFTIVRKPL